MKQCRYCHKQYPESDFGVAKTTPDKIYRRRKCRYCYRKTKSALRDRKRGWIDEYKGNLGCEKCGIKDFRVLDFHHRSEKDKEFSIADFYYYQFSLDKIKEEIAKCEVVCANCYRILHYENKKNAL